MLNAIGILAIVVIVLPVIGVPCTCHPPAPVAATFPGKAISYQLERSSQ